MIDPELRNRVVVVTGGNNPLGIGAATARAFAAQGAAVFIHFVRQPLPEFVTAAATTAPDLPSPAKYYKLQGHSAQELVDSIRAAGGRAAAWEADLSDPDVAAKLFDHAEKALGPVEVLVNNAAAAGFDTFLPGKSWVTGDACMDSGKL